MKTLALLLLVATSATFAYSGIVWSRHYTIRKGNTVCAVDIVKLDTGRYVSEKYCFTK